LQEQKSVERAQARAEIAQQLQAGLDSEGDIDALIGTDRFPMAEIVRPVDFGKAGEFAACRPVEIASIHDEPADGRSMTSDIFGCRVDHHICAEFEWAYEIGRSKRIIDNQWNAVFMAMAATFSISMMLVPGFPMVSIKTAFVRGVIAF